MKKYAIMFFTMLKIGLFTFGGGYAMLAILRSEFVERKKWLTAGEFMDMTALAESTPGPIAINSATYIGYKAGGVLGSILATLGVCIPSFVIIYLISLVFDRFLAVKWVAAAFGGIRVCVIFLIFSAGIKMFVGIPKTFFNVLVTIAVTVIMILFSVYGVGFSSIFYILIAAALGLTFYFLAKLKSRGGGKKGDGKK